MKKFYFFSLLIPSAVLLSACAPQAGTSDYYAEFRQQCGDDNCCLESVGNAEKVSSTLYNADTPLTEIQCPAGTAPDANKCPGSYKWCVPTE